VREQLIATRGAVVNVASVHAFATSRNIAAYAASKGGLMAFTRAAALELAPHDVRVNAVLPGAVDTPALRDGLGRSGAATAAEANLIGRTPLQRIGRPSDIAHAILFLADHQRSSFITGQGLVVDGGALTRLGTE
jgi:NAD(P)-dependent dehydrogenase (short-subunit alcohol dehydrogenase family)